MRRSRPIVFGAVAVIVAAGLGIVAFADRFPSWVRPHFGDVLVVIAIYFALAFIAPAAHSLRLSIVTLVYAFAVECTQLYHTPALDRFRSTLLGQLSIGATFSWMDLVCYVIGVAVAFGFDKRFVLRFHRLRSD